MFGVFMGSNEMHIICHPAPSSGLIATQYLHQHNPIVDPGLTFLSLYHL
jgi:hypothetical protein